MRPPADRPARGHQGRRSARLHRDPRDGVTVATSPQDIDPVRWVVVTLKAQDCDAGPWLTELVGPDTVVVAIQNGVEHCRRASDRTSEVQG